MPQPIGTPSSPWWREPTMWLVVGGPLSVVLACVVTGVIIWQQPDPPIMSAQEVRELDAAARAPRTAPDGSTPALQARNHAATAATTSEAPR